MTITGGVPTTFVTPWIIGFGSESNNSIVTVSSFSVLFLSIISYAQIERLTGPRFGITIISNGSSADILNEGVNFVLRCLKNCKGGETFVPKLPSYNILDLAKAISPKAKLKIIDLLNFNNLVLQHFESSIKNNLNNSLYSAYNTINIDKTNEINVSSLFPMLEGQVAALSSGWIKPKEAINILSSLFKSDMYQPEQNSFMLYPQKKLKRFLDKNVIPDDIVNDCNLFKKLLQQQSTEILYVDGIGKYRFNESLINSNFLEKKLDLLSKMEMYFKDVQKERSKILDYYLEIFDHQNYTGRSGTMYAYEGIGSIYWHMVSKLLLATQELFFKAVNTKEHISTIKELGDLYYKIRSGLSSDKTPEQYGAFPYDPYSHTPYKRGAQQPGMTGQVKEEIITRMGELGCSLKNGTLVFQTDLLKLSEFLKKDAVFSYVDINHNFCKYDLKPGQLGFTYCQVPIIYQLSEKDCSLSISFNNQSTKDISGNVLPSEVSNKLFSRSGEIKEITVNCLRSSFIL